MKNFKTIILTTITATLLTGCCLIDHTKTIEKVAEPMLKELEVFYKTNKRFPNTKERDVMLEKSGCKMKGDICMFDGEELTIAKSKVNLSGDYDISIEYIDKKTSYDIASCGFVLYSDYTVSSVICAKRPCLELKQ
jgi:hypothetical protein